MSKARFASLLSAFLFVAGCGGEPPPKPTTDSAADAQEKAKIAQSQKMIDEANEAISEKSYKRARKHLADAQKLAVESQRYEVEEALDKIDKREAKAIVKEEEEKLKNKDCAGAFAELAKASRERQSEAFTRELRVVVAEPAVKCVEAYSDDAVLAMKYADARALVEGDDAKEVLGSAQQKKRHDELSITIEEGLRAQLADDIKKRNWEKAVEKIDAWVKKGDADEEEGRHLMGTLRKAAAPELIAICDKGIGSRDGEKALKQVDVTVKLLRMDRVTGEAAELEKDKAMPEDLARAYRGLATWVEAEHLKMKPLKKAERRFGYGKVAVMSPMKSSEDAKRDVLHGQEVFVIGTAKDKALVSEKDPGDAKLPAMLEGALGWVPIDRLKKDPTIDWVLPDDQLKGERVWAPMRGDASYELGTVTDVNKTEVSVRRLADDQIIKVPRAKVRSGRLAAGTRVITFCTAKDQPAQVVEVLPTGSAKLKCDGGQEKEEVLPSLRSTVDILPKTN